MCDSLNRYYNHTPELRKTYYDEDLANQGNNVIRLVGGVHEGYFTFVIGKKAFRARVYSGNRFRYFYTHGRVCSKKALKVDLVTRIDLVKPDGCQDIRPWTQRTRCGKRDDSFYQQQGRS